MMFLIFSLSIICNNIVDTISLQDQSIFLFNEYLKNDDYLNQREIRFAKKPNNEHPDIEIMYSLALGKNILLDNLINIDSIKYKLLSCESEIKVPKKLQRKCLNKMDFIADIFCPVIIDSKIYVEIKLRNRNGEKFYFITEFDSLGQFIKSYHQFIQY